MKKVVVCVAGCIVVGIACAANHPAGFVKPIPSEVVPLWTGDAPGLVTNARPETVVNERIKNVSIPELLVYLPPKEKSNGTSLIICAGGGYSHLAMCLHVENVVRLLNEQGIKAKPSAWYMSSLSWGLAAMTPSITA